MDMTQSIVPRSDQLNSDDLVSAPVIVTIKEVRAGNTEQPVEVHTEEFPGRPYKPSKSMRRVMVQAWGAEASQYTGRKLKLFRNPDIKFGGMVVGGIEIEAMSHIDKPLSVSLMVTRGKRKPFTVQPLKDAPAEPVRDWDALIDACTTEQELRALYGQTTDESIQARILAARETLNTKDNK